ncbi:hypothetical protein ACJX0J_007371, partial [Zea mays]
KPMFFFSPFYLDDQAYQKPMDARQLLRSKILLATQLKVSHIFLVESHMPNYIINFMPHNFWKKQGFNDARREQIPRDEAGQMAKKEKKLLLKFVTGVRLLYLDHSLMNMMMTMMIGIKSDEEDHGIFVLMMKNKSDCTEGNGDFNYEWMHLPKILVFVVFLFWKA